MLACILFFFETAGWCEDKILACVQNFSPWSSFHHNQLIVFVERWRLTIGNWTLAIKGSGSPRESTDFCVDTMPVFTDWSQSRNWWLRTGMGCVHSTLGMDVLKYVTVRLCVCDPLPNQAWLIAGQKASGGRRHCELWNLVRCSSANQLLGLVADFHNSTHDMCPVLVALAGWDR